MKTLEDLTNELGSLRQRVETCERAAADAPEKPELAELRGEVSRLREQMDRLARAVELADDEPADVSCGPEWGPAWMGAPGGLTAVKVGGRRWEQVDWTKLEDDATSDFLKVPFDGVTAPSYMTEEDYDAIDWTTAPDPTDADEIRNANLVLKISETPGPCLPVPRA